MKKDFSRYFSGNPLTRLPLHKVVLSLVCVLALTVSLGAGIVATAMYASPASSSAGGSSAPAATAAPTATPAPSATPKPDEPVLMECTVVQQSLGVDLFYVNPPKPEATPEPTVKPTAKPSASPTAGKKGAAATASPSPTPTATPTPTPTPTATPEPESNEPVPVVGVAFKISVTDEKNKQTEYDVDTESGTLLIEDMEPGTYTVTLLPAEGFVSPEPQTVTIKEKVVYKPDTEKIKEQIKTDAEASAEDTKPAAKPAPKLEDTVRFAESDVQVEETKAEVYLLEGNVKDGKLLYSDGTVSPYVPVTEEKNGVTYIVKAKLETVSSASFRSWKSPLSDQFGMPVLTYLSAPPETFGEDTGEGEDEENNQPGGETESSPAPSASTAPTQQPESTPEATQTPAPTATPVPETTPSPTPDATSTPAPTATPTPAPTATASPSPAPSVSPSPSPSVTPSPTPLPDNIVLFSDGKVRPSEMFQLKKTEAVLERTETITGWYTDSNNRQFYYDPDTHQPVTGQQVIQGEMYTFLSSGERKTSEMRGIDVSKYQPNVDWNQVKASGIDFVIIRAGYRGWGTGALVEDPLLASHVAGARAAGLRIGLYFFTQAVDEQEAVDEASFVVSLIKKYGIPLSMPVYYDTENSDGHGAGRADHMSRSQRTANTVAFCETMRNAGYTPGVYSYRSWLTGNLNFAQISRYSIWVAHFASQLDFPYKHDMWQYTSNGSVPGIPGRVDMNLM